MQITTIGLDIAKNVFQVHGIDAEEKVVDGVFQGAAAVPDRHGTCRHEIVPSDADGNVSVRVRDM